MSILRGDTLLSISLTLCTCAGAQHAMEGADTPSGLPWLHPPVSRGSLAHHDGLQYGLQGTLPPGVCPPGLGQPSWTGKAAVRGRVYQLHGHAMEFRTPI